MDIPEAELVQIESELARYPLFHETQARRFIAARREGRRRIAVLEAMHAAAGILRADTAHAVESGAVRPDVADGFCPGCGQYMKESGCTAERCAWLAANLARRQ